MRFLFALPWTRFIVPGWTGWNKQKEVRKRILASYDVSLVLDFYLDRWSVRHRG